MHRPIRRYSHAAFAGTRLAHPLTILLLALAAGPAGAAAQETQPIEGLRIRRVEFVGLQSVSEAYVRRLVRAREEQPYLRAQVEQDVRELLRSRKFLAAFATPRIEDGQVVVVFTVQEKPAIVSVEIEGNKRFTDNELYELTPAPGAVLDRYEVNRAREDILQKYKQKGHYYAQVELDEAVLENESRVIYRILEGPRVRVKHIRFEGHRAFGPRRMRARMESQTYFWILRSGALDEERVERDALAVQKLYRDEGYIDARVGYRLDFDPIRRADLDLVFVIEEGPRYRVSELKFEGHQVFANEQLRENLRLQPGSFAREESLQLDLKTLEDMYGEIGYVGTEIDSTYEYLDEPALVNIRYRIAENVRSRFGRITIRGNVQTRDEVIRRELRFYPGEWYNTVAARKSEQRIRETGLFKMESVAITPLADIEGEREALVQVEETETTQFIVGFGVSTDNGVIGTLSLENRNFDIMDWPKTWGEFFRGKAFKGDGQRLLFQLEPGTEVSRFRITFTEPYLFDKPLRFDTSLYLFQRGRDAYDEQRIGFMFSLSKRFEGGILDRWAFEISPRMEQIDINDVDPFAARDIRDAKGGHYLSAVRFALVRDTTDSRMFPTEGYRMTFAWEQAGLLGGEYSFGKPSFSYAWYKTVSTDILDRKSVLAFRADAAYIVGDAPVFERYYAGGFGSLRGFAYRGISPRGGIKDNAIGGDFILLCGGEYSFPLYGKTFRGVTFIDMGTVEEGVGISSWRASFGFGLRVQVDFFGPVPIVFDFGFPIAVGEDDQTQFFNFAFGASF